MTTIDFTKEFATYSNSDLLKIIENPKDYQPLAVEAAQAIIATRHVTDHDMEIARMELSALHQQKEARNQKKHELDSKIKDITGSIISVVNPVQTKPLSSESTIKVLSAVFAGYSLLLCYSRFGMILFMFSDHHARWDLSTILYLSPVVFMPIATVLFFKRKKLGWILLSAYLTYVIIQSLTSFVLTLNMQLSVRALNFLLPPYSLTTIIWSLLFFGGTFWVICKAPIREIYRITKKIMFTTMGIAAAITIVAIT